MAINDSCRIPGDACSEGGRIKAGLCNKHYHRFRRFGDPLAGGTGWGEPSAFLARAVEHSDPACLEWPYGKLPCGYGVLAGEPEGTTLAHRIVLIRTAGDPPEPGMEACHLPGICHNRSCVNPAHLYWGTKDDNQQDRVLDGTDSRGERCGNAKLTKVDVLAIRSSALTAAEEAARHGVHPGTISKIRRRKLWAHLP